LIASINFSRISRADRPPAPPPSRASRRRSLPDMVCMRQMAGVGEVLRSSRGTERGVCSRSDVEQREKNLVLLSELQRAIIYTNGSVSNRVT